MIYSNQMEGELNISQPLKSPTPKRSKRFIYLVIFIIVIFGLGFGINKFSASKESSTPKPSITPTPTEFQIPTDLPTPSSSPTPEESPSPTPKPTVNPVDKATGLDRSELLVSVQNGSGEVGVANKGSETLKSFGYNVVSIGNADNFEYENVVIQVKAGKSDYLALLKKDLAVNYTIGTTSEDLSASSSADALVIIGK